MIKKILIYEILFIILSEREIYYYYCHYFNLNLNNNLI